MNTRRLSRIPVLFILFIIAAAHPILKAQSPSVTIESIEFEGNEGFSSPQLRNLLRLSFQGGPYSAPDLSSDLLRLQDAYQDEGFLHAVIKPPDVRIRKAGDKEFASIRIRIEEGPLFVTGNTSIHGASVLGTQVLLQMYPLEKLQPYRRSRISQWLRKIEEAYASLGYMRARCEIRESLNPSAKTVDGTVECSEGKQYSVGTIAIIGDESVDRQKFKRRLLLSEGGVFNAENLALSVQFLNQSGLYKFLTDSDIEIRIDDARGVVNLKFRVSAPAAAVPLSP
ncbi:MAG: POTRA domain-containing protein [Acidobacteriota bacterium]|nr:POTRA domain-containing protein [Acidobacteriota bacterium]